MQFLVHDGPEEPIQRLLSAAGIWTNELHDEIYVFDSGFWQKDHALWVEVQKANWDDVILKAEFKKRLQKDVLGFFESEELYKRLAIPWKVGGSIFRYSCVTDASFFAARYHHARSSRYVTMKCIVCSAI